MMTLTAVAEQQRERFGPGGGVYRIIARAEETAGRHFAFEAIEPPGGGPPLHIHTVEDEYFAVLDGEITFFIDGRVRTVAAGGSAFVPRGVPHCFKNCSTTEARVLVLFTPGTIEGFFDYGLPVNGTRPADDHLMRRIVELAPQYGLEVLGPSPL
jgi:uncharacterized cupin superfamily protein